MSIIVHQERPISVNVQSGSWIGNTISIRGLLKQIVIHPVSDSTMYDFSLTNNMDEIVYKRTDVSGELNEELDLPVTGVYTMQISNSTTDGSFNVLLSIRET